MNARKEEAPAANTQTGALAESTELQAGDILPFEPWQIKENMGWEVWALIGTPEFDKLVGRHNPRLPSSLHTIKKHLGARTESVGAYAELAPHVYRAMLVAVKERVAAVPDKPPYPYSLDILMHIVDLLNDLDVVQDGRLVI